MIYFRPSLRSLAVLIVFLLCAQRGLAQDAAKDAPRPAAVKCIFVGDIMLADLPGKAIEDGKDPFADFAEVFSRADLVVGNLECVIATKGKAVDKSWTFRAHPRVLPFLKKHFDAVSLANNHTGDFGHEAFLEQLDFLKAADIKNFGGGKNLADARRPLILEVNGLRLALLGYNEFRPQAFAATDTAPGVAWSFDEHVVADIETARAEHKADFVIPFMHWGWEYYGEPNDRQKTLARLMIDAGADMVIGAHPHVTQGAEEYKGKLIVYSLGNFVFDGFVRPEALKGWLLRFEVTKDGLQAWDTVVAKIDDQGIPHIDEETIGPSGKGGTVHPRP